MDQIDNHSGAYVQQHLNNDLSFQYATNYAEQFLQHNNDESTCEIQSPNVEHDHDENEQISTSFIYKKRIRTKFNQEQLDILEATFQQHRYPSVGVVDDLVEQLNLPTQKITVWFQNRRARLKKTQQKLDNQPSSEKDDQQQYDSGIHLDEDASHESSVSPPINSLPHLPPPPPPMTIPYPYYLPNTHHPFHNSMWPNFHYPLPPSSFQASMANASHMHYNLMNYNTSEMPSPFVFQDVSNYQHQREFNNEL